MRISLPCMRAAMPALLLSIAVAVLLLSSVAVTAANPSFSITPAAVELLPGGTQQFTATVPVAWSAACGTINAKSGLFIAPTSAGSCIVTATATNSSSGSAHATVAVQEVDYLTWKGSNNGAGVQNQEALLSPSTVNSAHFKVKWTAKLDGGAYAQPLYVSSLTIKGVSHNVVFAATSNDSIYAYDGDTGALLWHKSFLSKGVTSVTGTMVGVPNSPTLGILGTPVIDASTGTLYAVTETAEKSATYFPHRLHAIDVTSGSEKFGGPTLISDPKLPPILIQQRPALTLANGMIYVGFGGIQDKGVYHGFLFAYDKQTLAQKYVWNATATGSEGSLWMSGASPAVDAAGNLYVTTANGSLNGKTNFGQAAVKLDPTLKVLDYFAPFDYVQQNKADLDLGSGSVALLPDQTGKFPHELLLCGKPAAIFVLNRDQMGHVGKTADNIIQRLPFDPAPPETCFATPAFFNGNLYIAGSSDTLKMFALNPVTGLLATAPASHGAFTFGRRGAQPVVSANGDTNGIVWTMDFVTGQIFANDASKVSTLLYSGSVPGGVIRFTVPTVVNGHVYVGGQHELVAYSVQ